LPELIIVVKGIFGQEIYLVTQRIWWK